MSYYRDVQFETETNKNVSLDVSDRRRNLSIHLTSGGVAGGCILTSKTTEEWEAAPGYVPGKKEIAVYTDAYHDDDDNPIPRIKIGDGNTVVGDLPFVDDKNEIENGIPSGGLAGDLLSKVSDADYNVAWVTPANSVEQDNTRPITAAAVYTEIGNINALLATI